MMRFGDAGGLSVVLRHVFRLASLAILATPTMAAATATPPIMVVGIDTKFWFDDKGARVFRRDTGDAVQVYDLADPAHPALIGTLAMTNSVVGPPTNLAITPDGRLALIASSLTTVRGGDGTWTAMPDDIVNVVDTAARPPRLLAPVKVGAQPSGLAINAAGTMALVANRAGKSVSVLNIHGQDVKLADTIPLGEVVSSVAFTPDGKRALVCAFAAHKIVVLEIAGEHVRRTGVEMPVGLWPYTVTVTPDGRLGLAGSDGMQAASTGNMDPVAVIDLAKTPPRTVDFVTAGDAIEGLVVSPSGEYAAATILQGSLDAPKDAWFRHEAGRVVLLRIAGDRVTVAGSTDVGAFPEGVAFSPDGQWIYVGNFGSVTISVLHIEGGQPVDTHADIRLPGPPAALRIGSQ